MEIVKMKCPNCNANIEVNKEGMARCPYCKTGLYAERKDEKVIINTTINNYNMTRPHDVLNRTQNTAFKIIGTVFFVIGFLTIVSMIYMSARFANNGTTVGDEQIFTPRTAVGSVPMVRFVELVFQKPITDITENDYNKVKAIRFVSSLDRDILDETLDIEYELNDGFVGRVNIPEELVKDTDIEFEDFQCFNNLQSLDISKVQNITKGYDYTTGTSPVLSNLVKLESFAFNGYSSLEELEGMFSDTSNIKELSINIYEGFDMDTFVEDFNNLEKLEFLYVDDDIDESIFSKLSNLDKLESLTTSLISDNSYLSSLTNLKFLSLKGSDAHSDYSVLYGMPQLETLIINSAKGLKSIDFVRNMQDLSKLYIIGSDINSVEELSGKSIKELMLKDNNELKDYSSLLTLAELDEITISLSYAGGDINIPDFSSLANIKKVNVSNSLLEKFVNNTAVEELSVDIGLTDKIDIAGIANMTNLSKLTLYGDGDVGDFTGIENLVNLKTVDMHAGTDEDISPLFNLASIESINIDTQESIEINPANIADNSHLKELNIYKIYTLYDVSSDTRKETKIGDIAFILDKFTALERLSLRSQGILDLGFAQTMPNLNYIDISDNYVKDVSPLVDLGDLKMLICPKNQVANLNLLSENVTVVK